jgi:hypothetical protein
MDKKTLNKLLKKWIKILHLGKPKWKEITIDFGAEEQDEDTPIGFCIWSFEEQTAAVYIASPEFYETGYAKPLDLETTEKILIHELLHLTLQTGSTKNHQMFEQGLNVLSDVLWEAYGDD